MSKPFYLTTPLYYVNAAPHIGHSYTEVAADALARYHRLKGEPVFLLTGTDEHGQKIAQAAAAVGQPPQAFVDQTVSKFTSLWKLLNIAYDDFVRTTQPRHVEAVKTVLIRLHEQGILKPGSYQGWYCTPDETFWSMEELAGNIEVKAPSPVLCPSCGRPLEEVKEEGWFLPLRKGQDWLRKYLKDHPTFIRPQARFNEIYSLLEQPLPEYLCITRPKHRVSWGIEVPFSTEHVVYVWFDALLNYITVPGYVDDPAKFSQLWPADLHFIGKDILRHHAVYWPIMLHALGFSDEQMPRTIFSHGWWKVGEQKMSKSLGNIVNPFDVVTRLLNGQPYAADVYRYFLLREVPFGQDGTFSEDALLIRLNTDLANDLGNLVNRACSMIERYSQGKIPQAAPIGCAVEDEPLRQAALGLAAAMEQAMGQVDFSTGLETIMRVVTRANQYIERTAPWKLAKQPEGRPRLETVLNVLAEVIRIGSICLEPFMPSVSVAIWTQLGFGEAPRRFEDAQRWGLIPAGQAIGPHPVLFPRQT